MHAKTGPILVGIDFSTGCLAALGTAVRLARGDGREVAALHVIESLVIDDFADASGQDPKSLEADVRRDALNAWRDFTAGVPEYASVRFEVAVGHRVEALLAAERTLNPSLVVLGARGISGTRSGGDPAGAGSTATSAVRKCRSDVLLVRGDAARPFRRILVGIDFSPTSRRALAEAVRIARHDGASLHALHVFNGPWHTLHYRAPTPEADPRFQRQYRTTLEHRLAGLLAEVVSEVAKDVADAPVPAGSARLSTGSGIIDQQSVRGTILDQAAAEGADLVVIGRRGRSNLRDLLLGSTAEKVLRELDASLFAARVAE